MTTCPFKKKVILKTNNFLLLTYRHKAPLRSHFDLHDVTSVSPPTMYYLDIRNNSCSVHDNTFLQKLS